MTTSTRRKYRNAVMGLAVALVALVVAFLLFGRDAVDPPNASRFCAIPEGSGTTYNAQIRGTYLEAFDRDVRWFARQPGEQPMCLILATGTPTNNPIATAPVDAEDPDSPDADDEVAANIATLDSQFAQLLATAVDPVGTPLMEALYALALAGAVGRGDTVSLYTDMRQNSVNLRITDFVGSNRPPDLAEAINARLDQLAGAGILPDGRDGHPSLSGVRIAVPVPEASISASKDNAQAAERLAVTRTVWTVWAKRTGAVLLWGRGADGQV
jgi:hypothetical protein